MCKRELTEFFPELTEFTPKLSEFSPPKQYSRNSIPPVSYNSIVIRGGLALPWAFEGLEKRDEAMERTLTRASAFLALAGCQLVAVLAAKPQ